MQIIRETDYAIRCLLVLSEKSERNVSALELSKELKISQAFISKILQKLVKAGLLKSVRGVGGGVQVRKRPEEMSLYDVVNAIQGPLGLNICVLDDEACHRRPFCSVHPVWVEIQEVIYEKLKSCSFQQLLEDASAIGSQRERNGNHGLHITGE